MLAVVFFLRPFVNTCWAKIPLRTDHSALQWLRRTPRPVGQQARWLTTIEEFDFDIQHRAGRTHANADAMSRRPHCIDVIRTLPSASAQPSNLPDGWTRETLCSEQRNDSDLGWVLTKLLLSDQSPTLEKFGL